MAIAQIPTLLRVVLVAQLVVSLILLGTFSSTQLNILRYQLFYEPRLLWDGSVAVALFCILVPMALFASSILALQGRSRAIRVSLVCQALLCIASVVVSVVILIAGMRHGDLGWILPLFLVIAAAIFLVSLTFVIILYRHLRNSNATGNA